MDRHTFEASTEREERSGGDRVQKARPLPRNANTVVQPSPGQELCSVQASFVDRFYPGKSRSSNRERLFQVTSATSSGDTL